MSFGSSPTTTLEGALPVNQIFISSVAEPGRANGDLTALEGGPGTVDSNSNRTAPASMYVKDGADVTTGAKTDPAVIDPTAAASVIALLKGLLTELIDIEAQSTTTPVVSGSVSVSNFPGTQPVSATSLPLPTGAATAAKQPAIGTAGTPAADVTSVQGVAGGTPQPVSGTVTANAGTGTYNSDVTDRVARLLGHVIVDSLPSADITDRSGRQIGTETNSAAIKTDLDSISNSFKDIFGTATALTAATTFAGVPTISQLAASSFVSFANPGNQATFLAAISVASAFVGTLSFYGVEPDGVTLQLINAHQRATSILANNTAINTGAALNQTWMGSIADFKAIYVVCTAFSSGSVSVQLGLTPALYSMTILNTASVKAAAGDFIDLATLAGIVSANKAAVRAGASDIVDLATLAAIVSGNKAAVKAAAGDIADLTALIINTANAGTPTATQGAGAAAGTSWRIKGDFTEQATLSAGSLNADLLPSTDVSAYAGVSLHINANAYVGTLTFAGSNDGILFNSVTAFQPGTTIANSFAQTATSTSQGWFIPRQYRYLRVRMTSYTSGAANATAELLTTIPPQLYVEALAIQSGTWNMVQIPATSGGTITYHTVSAASNNSASVKGSAGQVYGWDISNTNVAWRYVKLFNKATAPTPGTDTVIRTIGIPPGGKANGLVENGQPFSLGIGIAIVTGIADSDNTSAGASDVVVDLDYK